jgi:hypothetical protein
VYSFLLETAEMPSGCETINLSSFGAWVHELRDPDPGCSLGEASHPAKLRNFERTIYMIKKAKRWLCVFVLVLFYF